MGLDIGAVFDYCKFHRLTQEESADLIEKLKVIEREVFFKKPGKK